MVHWITVFVHDGFFASKNPTLLTCALFKYDYVINNVKMGVQNEIRGK